MLLMRLPARYSTRFIRNKLDTKNGSNARRCSFMALRHLGENEAEKGTAEPNPIIDGDEAKLNKLAEKVRQYRLEFPAVLFLEGFKPASTIFGEITQAYGSVFFSLFGVNDLSEYIQVLENRSNIQRLIEKIQSNE